MAKKGKKGKKGKKAKEPELTGPEAEAEAERLALIETAKALKKQKEMEEIQFNEFQQQKEKLNYFWIVDKKNLEDAKAEFRNKERELQDLEEKHQVEIKVYKQRVKHLLFEHMNEITQLKTQGQVSLKLGQDEHREGEAELKADKRALKVMLKEKALAHEEYLKAVRLEQDKAITMLRLEFEREAKELQTKYDDLMKTTRTELEDRRKADIQRIDDRKAQHTAALMEAHAKAFADIKNYYNDITHSNLDLIKHLKEKIAELRGKEAGDQKLMHSVAMDNRKMSEPLKKAAADVQRLRAERDAYRADVETLLRVKAQLLVLDEKQRAAKWEYEVLEQRFERLVAERDDLYEKFQTAVYDVQQKAGFKNLLLEKKLDAADTELTKKEAALSEVLTQARLDPAVLGVVTKQLDEMVESKDATIRELQTELQRVIAQHNRLVFGYERKLQEYGIPVEELGFQPIKEPSGLGITGGGGGGGGGGGTGILAA